MAKKKATKPKDDIFTAHRVIPMTINEEGYQNILPYLKQMVEKAITDPKASPEERTTAKRLMMAQPELRPGRARKG